MKKKIYVSTDETDVIKNNSVINFLLMKMKDKYPEMEFSVFLPSPDMRKQANTSTYCLGELLSDLSESDFAYFVDSPTRNTLSQIEYSGCTEYGVKVIE